MTFRTLGTDKVWAHAVIIMSPDSQVRLHSGFSFSFLGIMMSNATLASNHGISTSRHPELSARHPGSRGKTQSSPKGEQSLGLSHHVCRRALCAPRLPD